MADFLSAAHTFTRLPPSQWKSAWTTNAVERLHEEFKRRIKTQTVLPSAETAAMLFWALLAQDAGLELLTRHGDRQDDDRQTARWGSHMRCLLSLAGLTVLTVGGLAAGAGLLGLGMLGGVACCCRPRRRGGPGYV